MKQMTFSIRMDEELKEEFESLCDQFGMSMSAAFNIFAKKVVLEKRIPFNITSEKEPETTFQSLESKIDKLANDTKNIRNRIIKQIKENH